jgi:putative transposase
MSVLVGLKNRGVRDVFFFVCDGLEGLPEVVENVWPHTIVQTCIIHLMRNSFRLVPRQQWDALRKDLKLIYTAPTPDAAAIALEELDEKWGRRYGALIRLVAQRVGTVHPLFGLRRRNKETDLLHQRDRIPQRTIPPRGTSTRPLPHRTGSHEMPVPCNPQPRPHRGRQHPMDDALEARDQRVRHHLR